MRMRNSVVHGAWAATLIAVSAFADDCDTVKNAMLNSGHTPHAVTVTKIDGQEKKTVSRLIQTLDNKYVQTAEGKWYALNIGVKDLDDNTSGVLACRRVGSESVGGEPTAVYEVHANLEGELQDQKVWIASNNRVLKTEGIMQGARYITEYDFNHVTPPSNALSMGGK